MLIARLGRELRPLANSAVAGADLDPHCGGDGLRLCLHVLAVGIVDLAAVQGGVLRQAWEKRYQCWLCMPWRRQTLDSGYMQADTRKRMRWPNPCGVCPTSFSLPAFSTSTKPHLICLLGQLAVAAADGIAVLPVLAACSHAGVRHGQTRIIGLQLAEQ